MRGRAVITMYDTALNGQFPAGAAAYAAYVDGSVGNQPNYDWVVAAFPKAEHLSIALLAGSNADALDVESGAASASDVPGWHARQVARGIARPVVYASAYTMEAQVLPVLDRSGIERPSVRLWSAHYGAGEHVCGPSSCRMTPVAMDGTQWTSSAMGRVLDQSLLLGNFFGAPAAPPTPAWTETLMQQLPELRQGATGTFVRTAQFQCGQRGHAVTVDGSFGPATLAAVKAVQAAAKITVDGTVGPQTWPALLGV
jgi:hypothetical protein